MKGVIVTAALIVAVMALIKDGRIFHRANMTGGCTAVVAPQGQTGAWKRCVAGRLQGLPSLTRDGCTAVATYGKTEFWRCPAEIDSAPGS